MTLRSPVVLHFVSTDVYMIARIQEALRLGSLFDNVSKTAVESIKTKKGFSKRLLAAER